MRYFATKERRREREEFTYLNRSEIENRELIIKLARRDLGYSCRTADCDIYTSIFKTYKKICLTEN